MGHKEGIVELHNQGLSYSQIAKELGCSKGTIAYHLGNGVKDKTFARQRDRRNKIRKYLQDYKQQHGCMDCREDYPYYILEFDHRPEHDKLFNLSQSSAKYSLEQIKTEVAKCDVVCSNCHRLRTWSRVCKGGESVLDLSEMYIE